MLLCLHAPKHAWQQLRTREVAPCARRVRACRWCLHSFLVLALPFSADTACSSSLVAAHAARELAAKTGNSAVVGGVNATLLPDTTVMFAAAGMLAADGRCKPLTRGDLPQHRTPCCSTAPAM